MGEVPLYKRSPYCTGKQNLQPRDEYAALGGALPAALHNGPLCATRSLPADPPLKVGCGGYGCGRHTEMRFYY